MRQILCAIAMSVISATVEADEGGKKNTPRQIDISVTESGFQPQKVNVKKGEEVTLAFTRKTDKTCAKEVVVETSARDKVRKKLPLGEVVPITVTFDKSGEARYVCGMDMVSGVVFVAQ